MSDTGSVGSPPQRVEVNVGRCESHGVCELAGPRVYRLDDEGELHVLLDPLPADAVSEARAGAAVCPMIALKIVDV